MKEEQYLEYMVDISTDGRTGAVTARVPALDIADEGANYGEALTNLWGKLTFHLDDLAEKGEPIPPERRQAEGLYIHVKWPGRAI
jgi:predicted RNase H-like HicB family nuclease